MSFNPTHEFRGLELEFQDDDPCVYGLTPFRDEDDNYYYIPTDVVTKIQPKPQPGEVWKYVGEHASNNPFNLVLISDEYGPRFVNVEGDTIRFDGDDLTEFVKVLNADGTPA